MTIKRLIQRTKQSIDAVIDAIVRGLGAMG